MRDEPQQHQDLKKQKQTTREMINHRTLKPGCHLHQCCANICCSAYLTVPLGAARASATASSALAAGPSSSVTNSAAAIRRTCSTQGCRSMWVVGLTSNVSAGI
jgi:hypothetical protein